MRWVLVTLMRKVNSFSKHFHFIIHTSRHFKGKLKMFGAIIAFGILIRLCPGWTSDWGVGDSIPESGKIFLSTPKHHDRVWVPHRLLFNEKWGLSPRGQATGMWSWPLRLSSIEVKNQWSYAYTPPYAFRVFTGTALTLTLALKVFGVIQYCKDYLRTHCILALVHMTLW
jgi:hypothetical protein